jgi:hypothetical protein
LTAFTSNSSHQSFDDDDPFLTLSSDSSHQFDDDNPCADDDWDGVFKELQREEFGAGADFHPQQFRELTVPLVLVLHRDFAANDDGSAIACAFDDPCAAYHDDNFELALLEELQCSGM